MQDFLFLNGFQLFLWANLGAPSHPQRCEGLGDGRGSRAPPGLLEVRPWKSVLQPRLLSQAAPKTIFLS